MTRSLPAILVLLTACVACAENVPAAGKQRDDAGKTEKVAAADDGVIRGRVVFDGEPPERKPVDMSAVQQCAELHKEPVLEETVIVNPDGTLRNVFVYLEGAPRRPAPKDGGPAVIDQVGCRYEPHVLGVRIGQDVLLKNSDPFLHNLHELPVENDVIGKGQPNNEPVTKLRPFKVHEFFPAKCDVHPWMLMYIGVFDNEFFAVTGDAGSFEIKGVPPGEYTLVAWHEKYGREEQAVKVAGGDVGEGDGQPVEMDFHFDANDGKNTPKP